MENQVQLTPHEMVELAIAKSKKFIALKIDWSSDLGMEIHYAMNSFANRGFFDNAEVNDVYKCLNTLIFIAKGGFNEAKKRFNDQTF